MENKSIKPHLIVIALLALTCLVLLLMGDVKIIDDSGLTTSLPDTIGEYTGTSMGYCQDASCANEQSFSDIENASCDACGGKIGSMHPAEKLLLPADTFMLRKRYSHPNGRTILLSILLTGKERTSIHRPQLCLTGQGRDITSENELDIEINQDKTLQVMLLDLQRIRNSKGPNPIKQHRAFAYWFSAKNRETHSHWKRTYWMALDNIFHGISHKWAFISVTTNRDPGSEDHKRAIQDFVKKIYPIIHNKSNNQ